jgi:phage tail-like protein
MALTAAEMKNLYPMPVYQFRVQVGGETMSFAEVSGLTVDYEMTTYKESATSGLGPVVMRMPGQIKEVHITLKRGIVQGSAAFLYEWINTTQYNLVEKKDITISLLDELGQPRLTWVAINAFPNKLDMPTFDAKSNDVAIETLALTADMVRKQ